MPTQTKKSTHKTAKSAPDLMGKLKTAQRKVEGKTATADQIAECIEAEAQRLQNIANLLRGKV